MLQKLAPLKSNADDDWRRRCSGRISVVDGICRRRDGECVSVDFLEREDYITVGLGWGVHTTFFGRKAAFASVAGEKVSEDRMTGDSAPGMFST